MADDNAKLVIVLEAQSKKMQNQLAAVSKTIDRFAATSARKFDAMNAANAASFARLSTIAGGSIGRINSALASIGVGVSLAGLQRLADTATTIQNGLKVAGLAGDDLKSVYDSLFQSAQRNAVPMETLVKLFSKAKLSADDLNASQADLLKFTDKVALSLRVSGQSAEQSAGALLQLGQALGDGKIQAQEYNSLLDGAQPLLRAVAAGMKEAGGSVATLTKLVKGQKVSSQAFFRAFLAGSEILDGQVAGSQKTISQGFQQIENSLVRAVGEFDDSTGAAQKLANAMNGVATAIDGIDVSGLIGKLAAARAEAENFFTSVGNNDVFKFLNGLNGTGTAAGLRAHGLTPLHSGNAFDDTFAALGAQQHNAALEGGLAAFIAGGAGKGGSGVKPISLADYPFAGGAGAGKGGAGKSNPYKNAVDSLAKRKDALLAETAAQAKLNPLVNDYGFAVTKAKAASDLEAAAKKAGIPINDTLRASIESLATGYANADVAAKQLADSQDHLRQTAETWRDTVKDATGSFIQDLIAGKSAADALGDALTNIGNQLLNMGLDALFGGGTFGDKSSPFGLIGKAFGFANGGIAAYGRPLPTFAGGGVSNSAAIFGEAGPEAAVPLPDGRRIPVDLRLPAGGGGALHVSIPINIDAAGADPAAVARLSQAVAQMKADLPHTVIGAVRTAKKQRKL